MGVRYWEGAVTVVGRQAGRAVAGLGYVELVGYGERRPRCSGDIERSGMAHRGFDLGGKVAVVTGGNSGIGLGMAEALAQAGAAVCVWGTSEEKNAAARARLEKHGGQGARPALRRGRRGGGGSRVRGNRGARSGGSTRASPTRA